MSDASPTPSPAKPTSAATAKSKADVESLRDRMSAAARRRVERPRAILVLYALVALGAIVVFVGQLAGWWTSAVEDKIRANNRRANQGKSSPSPAPSPSDAAMSAPGGSK
jgi:hypothetical protein